MFQRLSTRLWLTYTLLAGIMLCVIAAGLLIYVIRIPTPARQLYNQLQLIATFIQRVERLSVSRSVEQLQQIATRSDNNFDVRIIILDPDHQVIVDSRINQAAPLPLRFDRARLFSNNVVPTQFTDSNRQTWLFSKKTLQDGFILVVAAPRPRVTLKTLLRDEFLFPFTQAGILAVVAALIFSISISRWIAKPLEKIAATARSGNTEKFAMVDKNSPIEVQDLAAALIEMHAQVFSSQRAQRDLVANVSHDLKTPLTSIKGFAQAILDGAVNNPDQIHAAAQVIHSESERMNHMVVDLLELASLESGMIELENRPLKIPELLDDLVTTFSPQLIAKEIELTQDYSHLPLIIGDFDRLKRVFGNLLDNAIKFSPNKSKIVITGKISSETIDISITDNGPGVPEQDLAYIFDRFYQVDKTRSSPKRGTGLGLAIAKEIIHAHGGSISVKNNINLPYDSHHQSQSGCSFLVKLPVSKSQPTTRASRYGSS